MTALVWFWRCFGSVRFVIGVVAVLTALVVLFAGATLGLATLASDNSAKNRINCSGVSWDTPFELDGVNYLERMAETVAKLTDEKDSPKDAYYFVRGVKDVLHLWRDAIWGPLFGDVRANKAVTGYRNADEKAREKALRFCCVQLRKFQGQPPAVKKAPKVQPGPPAWDPKQASLQQARSDRYFDDEEMDIARITRQVAVNHDIPERGVLVALAAGFVESGMSNLDFGDRDSLGWLQQRPSAGWGTREQVRNPELAAEAFFGVADHTHNRGLTDIRGWQRMSIGRAAQAVQVSAYPGRYAAHVGDARSLLAAIGGMGGTSQSPTLRAKKPKFDQTVPMESYCDALDRWDREVSAMGLVDDSVDPNINDPGGKVYHLGPVRPEVQRAANLLGHKFGVGTIGGVRPDSIPDHPSGRAIDLMIRDRGQGQRIADYAQDNAAQLKVEYIIWNTRIWSVARSAEGWRPYTYTSNPHTDHVHITFRTGANA